MAAIQKQTGGYSDPSAAHEKAMRLKADGMGNVHMRKIDGRWVIYYVDRSEKNPRKPPIGKFIKADAVKFNRNGTVTLKVKQSTIARNPVLRRNVAAGYYDEFTGKFHPIRASYDYDENRVGRKKSTPRKRKATSPKRKPLAAKKRRK